MIKNLLFGSVYRTGSAVLLLAVAAILGALAFEHIGGYAPCPLCLEQRYAYYLAIPVLLLALTLTALARPIPAAILFAVVAAAFFANAVLAGYHAGAEWKFWPGPDTCAVAGEPLRSGGGLLKDLEKTHVVRCDEPALVILGLSLAGWNVLICLVLAAGSAAAAGALLRRRAASPR
jgi:disulfide bond formation protein DsbB